MGGARLMGVRKTFSRNEFVFEKSWNAIEAVDYIMEKLGIEDAHSNGLGNAIGVAGCQGDVDDLVDEVYMLGNDDYDIIVFIGKNKIILLVRCDPKLQNKVSKVVFEFADFEEESNDKN